MDKEKLKELLHEYQLGSYVEQLADQIIALDKKRIKKIKTNHQEREMKKVKYPICPHCLKQIKKLT